MIDKRDGRPIEELSFHISMDDDSDALERIAINALEADFRYGGPGRCVIVPLDYWLKLLRQPEGEEAEKA